MLKYGPISRNVGLKGSSNSKMKGTKKGLIIFVLKRVELLRNPNPRSLNVIPVQNSLYSLLRTWIWEMSVSEIYSRISCCHFLRIKVMSNGWLIMEAMCLEWKRQRFWNNWKQCLVILRICYQCWVCFMFYSRSKGGQVFSVLELEGRQNIERKWS